MIVYCKQCAKSVLINSDIGTLDRHCHLKKVKVNGFESCKKIQEKQCTLCAYEKHDPDSEPCRECDDQDHFVLKEVLE